eukprot:TRINITY_DN10508_c0_g1_i1.p1 TRINITY_DN10508_c0_g1~~TRINITY_DN10508_c0_g1_i1.p1  ORF type:complete len:330 (+),score=95.91 TRINITY_DN10508_c0_g1_i1:104-1093(+)
MADQGMRQVRRLFWQQIKSAEVVACLKDEYPDTWAEEEVQEEFVATVLHNGTTLRHPTLPKYLWLLCKAYVKEVEMCGAGVSDALIEACMAAQPGAPTGNTAEQLTGGDGRFLEVSHKCYVVGDAVVPIRVWPEFSQVGLALWPAGFAVAEWVMRNASKLGSARIVELGSGVGLTGIVAALTTTATKIVMTDYLPTVNDNAKHNIAICDLPHPVDVDILDWVSVQKQDPAALEQIAAYDATCLLAADVVYDVEVVPALSDTFKAFLTLCPSLEHIVFAVTHRNEKTFQLLLGELLRNGLALQHVEDAPESTAFIYDRSLIKMYSLALAT